MTGLEEKQMDIKNLEAFLALADHLNFTKSAEQLYISQPAFSRQITKLEDEFGCELFTRNKRKVELTEYGREFANYAQSIFSEYEKWMLVLQRMKAEKIKKTGYLRIGFLQDLPHQFVPVAIRRFEAAHENIDLTLQDGTMSAVIDGLMKDTIDVGFTLSNEITEYHEISCLSLEAVKTCVALSANHPLADRESIRMEELRDETFVAVSPKDYGPGSRHMTYLCKKAGFEPRIAAYTTFVPSLLMMVGCGVGISIVAETARGIAPEGVTLVPLDEDSAHTEMLLMWKPTTTNPAVPLFVNFAEALLSNRSAEDPEDPIPQAAAE